MTLDDLKSIPPTTGCRRRYNEFSTNEPIARKEETAQNLNRLPVRQNTSCQPTCWMKLNLGKGATRNEVQDYASCFRDYMRAEMS